jgi:hypothetical protein
MDSTYYFELRLDNGFHHGKSNPAGGHKLYMSKSLNKSQLEKQKVLAFLDQADSEVPRNPGLNTE